MSSQKPKLIANSPVMLFVNTEPWVSPVCICCMKIILQHSSCLSNILISIRYLVWASAAIRGRSSSLPNMSKPARQRLFLTLCVGLLYFRNTNTSPPTSSKYILFNIMVHCTINCKNQYSSTENMFQGGIFCSLQVQFNTTQKYTKSLKHVFFSCRVQTEHC